MEELMAGLFAAGKWAVLLLIPGGAGYLIAKLVPSTPGNPNTGYKVLAGAGTGAVVGAAIGSVIPGIGTGIGFVVGGIAGAIGGYFA